MSQFNWTMTAARFSRSWRTHSLAALVSICHSLAALVSICVQAMIAHSRTGRSGSIAVKCIVIGIESDLVSGITSE